MNSIVHQLCSLLITRLMFFMVLLLLMTFPRDVLSQEGGHNSECSSSSSCDGEKHLECDSFKNTCDCPKTMLWNEKLRQCEMKEGQRCETGNSNNAKKSSTPSCIQHSSCVSGFCECDEKYLRNGFGSCFLSYNMPCNKSQPYSGTSGEGQECALRYGLECVELEDGLYVESRCRCRGESVDFVWDDYRQKCVSLVGTTCDGNEYDDHSAAARRKRDDQLECVQNADCINHICECKPEYSVTPDRKCLKKYGERCNNSMEDFCNRYSLLNCGDDGKCGCEFYGQMDYDEKVGECRMLVGENCELLRPGANLPDGRILHKCVEDAKCEMNSKYRHNSSSGTGGTGSSAIVKGKCTCEAGKIKTTDGKCTNLRSYNMSCSFAGDCDKSLFLTCFIDDERGGYCSCLPGEMFWSFSDQKCLSLPGRRCSVEKPCGRNSTCIEQQYCHCYEDFFLDATDMTCRPREIPTTTTTSTTTTLPPYYQEIIPESTNNGGGSTKVYSSASSSAIEEIGRSGGGCPGMDDEEKSLEFHRCSCKLNHSGVKVWSEEKALCLAIVGAACESDGDCIDLAYCEMEDRVCQCLPEARSTLNNTCVLRKRMQHNNNKAHHKDSSNSNNLNNDGEGEVVSSNNGGYLNERSLRISDSNEEGTADYSASRSSGSLSLSIFGSSSFKRYHYLMSLSLIPFIFNIVIIIT